MAAPSDAVRNGQYVYPQGPYAHIQANKGRAEAMMWAVERADGGRGFGFTGGHFHDNWANDDFRKVVLNASVWLTKAEVPADGIQSQLAPGQIDRIRDEYFIQHGYTVLHVLGYQVVREDGTALEYIWEFVKSALERQRRDEA